MSATRNTSSPSRLAPLVPAGLAALVAGSLLAFSSIAFNTGLSTDPSSGIDAATPATAAARPVVLPASPGPAPEPPARVAAAERPQVEQDIVLGATLGSATAGGADSENDPITARPVGDGTREGSADSDAEGRVETDTHRNKNGKGHYKGGGEGHHKDRDGEGQGGEDDERERPEARDEDDDDERDEPSGRDEDDGSHEGSDDDDVRAAGDEDSHGSRSGGSRGRSGSKSRG